MAGIPLATVLENFAWAVVNFLPNIVSAVILLVIGLIVGKIAGKLVKQVLDKVNVDRYVTDGKKPVISLSNIFSLIVKWWIYLAFITAAVSREVLGIPSLADWMAMINAFIPKVIGASVIVIAGYIIGEYIQQQVKKTETFYAAMVGKTILFFIVYVAIAMALPILGIPATLVNSILLIIVGALGIGMAIAIGLGLKGPVELIAKKYLQKAKYIK